MTASCTLFSTTAMVCPLCQVTIPPSTFHSCTMVGTPKPPTPKKKARKR